MQLDNLDHFGDLATGPRQRMQNCKQTNVFNVTNSLHSAEEENFATSSMLLTSVTLNSSVAPSPVNIKGCISHLHEKERNSEVIIQTQLIIDQSFEKG